MRGAQALGVKGCRGLMHILCAVRVPSECLTLVGLWPQLKTLPNTKSMLLPDQGTQHPSACCCWCLAAAPDPSADSRPRARRACLPRVRAARHARPAPSGRVVPRGGLPRAGQPLRLPHPAVAGGGQGGHRVRQRTAQ